MNKMIFKAIVGSQSYGTNIATSDIDYKGVYLQSHKDLLSFGYKEQVDHGKDECYYEVRRFLQLLETGNPTVLELLFSPQDCIIEKTPEFDLIVKHREKFLTKKCMMSFGGYAVAQIKKARGLDKKMNWEKSRMERKTPLDFCYVITPLGSKPLNDWLVTQKYYHQQNQQFYGVTAINNARDLYFIYPDSKGDLNYRGIINKDETSNEIRLSSIPKEETGKGHVMSYNKDGYIKHCNDYRSYSEWLEKRNTQRYVDVKGHNQAIDGKNLLHCRRLLDMAAEIARDKTISVRRPNAEYLLQIRRGEVPLDEIIAQAEKDIVELEAIYAASDLPDGIDREFVNDLLLDIRFYAAK